MIQVSLAIDHLLETVADVAKDMRDEGTRTIQTASAILVGGSFFIALLNLFLRRSPRQTHEDQPAAIAPEARPAAPLPLTGGTTSPALHSE
jgi:hypothetical protein